MDEATMLDRWAELVMSGKDIAMAPKVAATIGVYDAELERQKLMFKMQQWEDEKLKRKTQRDKWNYDV